MRRVRTNSLLALTMTTALAVTACSKGSTPASPLAPSSGAIASSPAPAPTPAPAVNVGGAIITGLVVSGASPASALQAAGVSRVMVTVVGTSLSTLTDDSGSFTLQNVPAGTQTLAINGNGIAAQVSVSSVSINEQIRLTVRVDGGGAALDDRQRETADSQVEVEGVINSVSGSTIVVGRLNTPVVIAPTASITRGGSPAKATDLVAGVRVEVHGTKTGTSVTATRINIEDAATQPGATTPTTDDKNNSAGELELTGTLTAKPGGTCPAITFALGSTTVVTNGTTQFDDAVCASLAAGDTVKVEGTRQSSTQMLAREVKRMSGATGSSSGSSGSNSSGADDKGGDNKGGSGGNNSGSGSSGSSGKGK